MKSVSSAATPTKTLSPVEFLGEPGPMGAGAQARAANVNRVRIEATSETHEEKSSSTRPRLSSRDRVRPAVNLLYLG